MLTALSFLIVMSIVVFVHELGHYLAAKRNGIVVEEFGFGYPPRLIRLGERNGTVYSINAIPFGGVVRMRGEDDPTQTGSFAAASKLARFTTLVAGAAMNFLLAMVLLAVLAMLTGMPDEGKPGAVVQGIAPGSPAEAAGLQGGDRIVAAGGTVLATIEDLQKYTTLHLGEEVAYEIIRTDAGTGQARTLQITMTPRKDPPENQGALGIQIGQAMRRTKPWEAAWSGIRGTGQIIGATFLLPAMLIRQGRPIGDAGFMGPLGIAATTGEVVRSAMAVNSISPVIWFVALLSAAIGITNLLPIPALDGGRILFVLVEAIRGKRVEPSQEGLIHLVGFGLMLLLVGLVTVREINMLVNGTFPSLGF